MTEVDALVVGGGPAGLAAAVWLGRYRRSTLVVDAGEHRNRWAEHVHGYLAADPCPPQWLLQRAHEQLGAYATVSLREDTVGSVERDGDGFVATVGDDRVRARAIVLATGVVDALPDIDDLMRYYGRSVFHCSSCDAFETRGADVVAIGWGAHVAAFARSLLHWARSVTVLTDGTRFEGDEAERDSLAAAGIDVTERAAEAFVGDGGTLRAVRLAGGDEIPCDAAFFSIAHSPRAELADMLGCERGEAGLVVTDRDGRTSVPRVYAAGDVTPGFQLVQIAAAEGTAAGLSCALDLGV